MKKPHWTEREKNVLKEHYAFISAERLREAMPGRSPRSIISQAYRMGVKKVHERLREVGRENVSRRWTGNPPT
jgi:hypothetical protein